MYFNKQTLSVTLSFLAVAFFTKVYGQDLLLEEASLLERSLEKQFHQSPPLPAGLLMGADLPFFLLPYFTTTIKESEKITVPELLSLPDPSYAEKALKQAMEREGNHYDDHEPPREETLTAERNHFSDPGESDPDISTSQQYNGKVPGIVMLVIGDPYMTKPLQDGGGNSKYEAPQSDSDSEDDKFYETADEEDNTSNGNREPEPKAPPQQEAQSPYENVCKHFQIKLNKPDTDEFDTEKPNTDDLPETGDLPKLFGDLPEFADGVTVLHFGKKSKLFTAFTEILKCDQVVNQYGRFSGDFINCEDGHFCSFNQLYGLRTVVNPHTGIKHDLYTQLIIIILDIENINLIKNNKSAPTPKEIAWVQSILEERLLYHSNYRLESSDTYHSLPTIILTEGHFTYKCIQGRNMLCPVLMEEALHRMNTEGSAREKIQRHLGPPTAHDIWLDRDIMQLFDIAKFGFLINLTKYALEAIPQKNTLEDISQGDPARMHQLLGFTNEPMMFIELYIRKLQGKTTPPLDYILWAEIYDADTIDITEESKPYLLTQLCQGYKSDFRSDVLSEMMRGSEAHLISEKTLEQILEKLMKHYMQRKENLEKINLEHQSKNPWNE